MHEPEDSDDTDIVMLWIACGLYEVERGELEDITEAYMTKWIYLYKKGYFDDAKIKDRDLLEADIAKIELLMDLRFKDLVVYDEKDGIA